MLTSLKQLDIVKIKLQKQEFKTMKITPSEFKFVEDYCKLLNYKISINNQMKTIKIWNEKLCLWGYVQKLNGIFYYGYFEKDSEGNKYFVKKYPLTDNFSIYYKLFCSNLKALFAAEQDDKIVFKSIGVNKREFIYLSCGIIDLGIAS